MTLSYWCASMLENVYQLKSSRCLKLLCTLFSLVTLWMILQCNMSSVLTIISILLFFLLIYPFYQQITSDMPTRFHLCQNMRLLIFDQAGISKEAELMRDTILTPYFIVLRFRLQHRVTSCLIARDSLDKLVFKSLLMRLSLL